jgi:hypothetical protein
VPAPIVVEVYAPAPRPQELAALIAACTRAAAPKECVSSDAKSAEPPLGVAIVRRDGDRARIELGLRSAPSAEWSTRDLVFQPGDDELERYRAIGFAIGTLVAGQVEPPPSVPVAEPEPPAPPRPPRPPRPRAPASGEPSQRVDAPKAESAPEPPLPWRTYRTGWIDASGSVGLGLIPGPPRAGGALRVAVELIPHGLFAVVEGSYAQRLGDTSLSVRWLGAAAGLGHPLAPRLRSAGVDVRLLVGFEHLAVTATEGELSASDSRWKPGVTAAIDGYWNVTPPLGVLLSAATFIAPKRTVVRSVSQDVGETPALGLSGFVGVRLRLR